MPAERQLQLLIVDDSSDVRRVLRQFVEAHSSWIVCDEAANGREGVEKANQLRPDAIVLDMSMPVMGGIEAARELKISVPSVPVILFTNFTEELFLSRYVKEAGIREVISKSNPDALLKALESVA